MTCEEIMTPSPACCSPDHSSVEAAELMHRQDVGLMPVVDGRSSKLVGVVTDRDIALKVVAAGRDPRGAFRGAPRRRAPHDARRERA